MCNPSTHVWLDCLWEGRGVPLSVLSTTYVSGSQNPYAEFTSINGHFGSGSYKFVAADGTTWTMSYDITATTATFTPVDAGGNQHTQLTVSMGTISFPEGTATPPENTYSWSITQTTGVTNEYSMALYPLTWSLEFSTYSKSFEHIFDYTNYPLDITISLNSGMWYFSSQPTNVYFGIASIVVLDYTTDYSIGNKYSTSPTDGTPPGGIIPLTVNNPVAAVVTPQNIADALAITAPTGDDTASQAFYSYEGELLNPQLFAPSVTTNSIQISNIGPSQYETYLGDYSGCDVHVYQVYTVNTLVVGDWVVKPTTSGTVTPTTPGIKGTSSTNIGILLMAVIAVVAVIVIYFAYYYYKKMR